MKELNDNQITQYKKTNRKLFILYKILSNDLLFYYTISFVFLFNVKGLNIAQIVFAESFYPIFKLIFQISCTVLIQKIGKRNSLIIKGIAESNLLYDSLDNTDDKKEKFSKIEGAASSAFYFTDAVTALLTGFLYALNPYLPISMSFITILLAAVVCFKFHDIPSGKSNSEKTLSAKEQLLDTYQGFKYIIKSSRLRALILFNSLFVGLLILMLTLHKSILESVNVPSGYLGIIFALMGIVISFSSSRSVSIHQKYRNKTLSIFGIILTLSIIITGVITIFPIPKFLMYYLLLLMITLNFVVKGPYYILIKQYLNSFCDSNMRIKIYSANLFFEYIVTAAISMSCSFLLNYFTNTVTTLIIGIVSTIIMLLLIKYMSSRVGLKPEEYSKTDIFFLDEE